MPPGLAATIHRSVRDEYRELADAKADRAAALPPIEVGRRDATEEEIGGPRTGRRQMLKAAQKAGWSVWATYARGPLAHATSGEFLRMIDSLALRMSHPSGHRCVATWEDGDFAGAWWLTPLKPMGSPDLKKRIQSIDTEPPVPVRSAKTTTEGDRP
jgi:hypothetical protein